MALSRNNLSLINRIYLVVVATKQFYNDEIYAHAYDLYVRIWMKWRDEIEKSASQLKNKSLEIFKDSKNKNIENLLYYIMQE